MTAFAQRFVPRRALLHPAWLGSLAVLAINDHVLKGAGMLPDPVTGKLSDFAGLMVAPLLLAVLVGLRSRRAWWAAHLAIGMVFAGIQLSPAFAQHWSAWTGWVGFPWAITCDPTDLVALPTLLLSAWFFPRVTAQGLSRMARRNAEVGAAAGGLVCCVATSPAESTWVPTIMADVFVHNGNDYDVVVRVRPLREGVDLDCSAIAHDPGRLLTEPLFDNATSWTLEPDANMVLLSELESESWGWELSRPIRDCHAYLVDVDNVVPSVVFWMERSLPTVSVEGTGLNRDLGGYVDVRHDEDGIGVFEAGSEILFKALDDVPAVGGQCAPADEAVRVTWSDELPAGEWMLGKVQEGPDGCVELELQTGFEAQEDLAGTRSYLCVPLGSFPFESGAAVFISYEAGGGTLSGAVESIRIEGLDPQTRRPIPGGELLIVSRGEGVSDLLGATATFTELLDCPVATEPACGTASRAGRVTLSGGELSTVQLSGSESKAEVRGREGGTITVELVHAQSAVVLDPECADGPDLLGTDIEIVMTRRAD